MHKLLSLYYIIMLIPWLFPEVPCNRYFEGADEKTITVAKETEDMSKWRIILTSRIKVVTRCKGQRKEKGRDFTLEGKNKIENEIQENLNNITIVPWKVEYFI